MDNSVCNYTCTHFNNSWGPLIKFILAALARFQKKLAKSECSLNVNPHPPTLYLIGHWSHDLSSHDNTHNAGAASISIWIVLESVTKTGSGLVNWSLSNFLSQMYGASPSPPSWIFTTRLLVVFRTWKANTQSESVTNVCKQTKISEFDICVN